MAATAAEVVWVVRLLEDLGISNLKPVTLHCDNMLAIHIAKNPVYHDRTKHIEIDCYFTREKYQRVFYSCLFFPQNINLQTYSPKFYLMPNLMNSFANWECPTPFQFEGGVLDILIHSQAAVKLSLHVCSNKHQQQVCSHPSKSHCTCSACPVISQNTPTFCQKDIRSLLLGLVSILFNYYFIQVVGRFPVVILLSYIQLMYPLY